MPIANTILDFGLVILDDGSLAGCRFQLAICPTFYLNWYNLSAGSPFTLYNPCSYSPLPIKIKGAQ
jgi:hypothetical protein